MKKLFAVIIVLSLTALALVVPNKKYEVQNVVLTTDNFVSMDFEVNMESVEYVILKLDSLDKSKPRYLYIRSPGGEVIAGTRLVEYLKSEDGKGVVAIAQFSASMAFVTLQASETRLITRTGVLMSHGISGGARGTIEQIEEQLDFMRKLENMLLDLIADRIGITREELREKHTPEWWIVGADEAVKANAVDGVASVTCSTEVKNSKLKGVAISVEDGKPVLKEVEVGPLCPL
ncbi:MAG: ATP-dependent Clp protease proteolytic subunit [Akkermansiaceae bacterium]|jgi:ATP-dependent protease ClpP protease subunit